MDNHTDEQTIPPEWESTDTMPEITGGNGHHFDQLKTVDETCESG